MPKYSFTCIKCSRYFETLLDIEDRNKKRKCNKCGGNMVRGVDKAVLLGFDKLGRSRK